jgi:hypothetical protein
MARSTVSCTLHEKVDGKKQLLSEKLKLAITVNLTVDIWSDRKMHAFFGMTVHYMSADHKLMSSLLSCDRVTGSYTGEKIAGKIDRISGEYQLTQKVLLVTLSTANMRKALTVTFTDTAANGEDSDDLDVPEVEQPEMWNNI